MEDVFSVNVESKENEDRRPAGGDADENEPDGPSEEDRGKAFVVHLRKSLLEGGHNGKCFLNIFTIFLTQKVPKTNLLKLGPRLSFKKNNTCGVGLQHRILPYHAVVDWLID